MDKRICILSVFFLVLSLPSLVLAQAGPLPGSGPSSANLWIDTNGGTCTRQSSARAYVDAQACSSMQAALTAAAAGDTIVIKNGTYGNQSLTSGGKASVVTFYAETYGSVLVSGLTVNIDKIYVYGVIGSGTGNSRGSLSVNSGGTGTLVNGFRGSTLSINAGNHITIEHCEFGNNNTDLASGEYDLVQIWSASSNITIKNNIFHDHHQNSTNNDITYHNDIMQFYPGGSNIIIDGNIFYNGPTSDIQAGGGTLNNWVVQNNYFGDPVDGGNMFAWGQASCGTLVFRNNVIGGNISFINDGGCSGGSVDISGNIYLNAVAAVYYGGPAPSGGYNVFPVSGGITSGSNARRCSPSWLNGKPSASNGYDIRLNASDTCAIDHGNPSNYAPSDMYGALRPYGGAPDAGANEFGAAGGVPPVDAPAAPGNLRMTSP